MTGTSRPTADDEPIDPERIRAVVAVHLFLLRGGEVLLLRRWNTGYEDGAYSVIAGHLDGDEPATLAMAREAMEEAGIEITPADLRFALVMHRKEAGAADERIDLFFAATVWQGEPTVREPEKCSELRWSALDELPETIVPYIRAALDHYLHDQPYAEFWPEREAPKTPRVRPRQPGRSGAKHDRRPSLVDDRRDGCHRRPPGPRQPRHACRLPAPRRSARKPG